MGLFTAIFGGSRAKSQQGNLNNNLLTSSLSPALGNVGTSSNRLTQLFNGDPSGFNNFKKAGGFDWFAQQGAEGVLGNMAAQGLLRSGTAGKALINYGNNMANQYLQNYVQDLLGYGNMGVGAGSVLADSGKYGTSSESKDTGAFGKFLGSALAFLSEPILKTDVEYIGELSNGLSLYSFNYVFGGPRHIGVMADEVEKKTPQYLGPKIGPYRTVNYGELVKDL